MGRSPSNRLAFFVALMVLTVGLVGCLDEESKPDRSDWAYEMTGLEALYDKGLTGDNVTVAVIDTGIDMGHDEFDDVNLVGWKDFVDNEDKPYDKIGHGTHVAGIIVAHGDLRGGAYNVNLLVAQVFKDDGTGDSDDVARAVRWATDQGADIITMSLGGGRMPILGTDAEDAVDEAIDKGVYVVAAAGNSQDDDDSEDDVKSPASVERVIAVGAIDSSSKLAPFSEHGDNEGLPLYPFDDREDPHKKVELVAPGVKVVSAWTGGKYATASGTSQATPFVAATLALLLEAYPEYKRGHDGDPDDDDSANIQRMKELLMDSAEKLESQTTPHDDGYGYGLIRADKAFEDWA